MTSALAWLERDGPPPIAAAGAGEQGLAGIRYDGLVGCTPAGTFAAADLLERPEGRAGTLRELLPAGAALAWTTAVWVHTGRLLRRRTDVVVEPDLRIPATVVVHRQHLAAGDVLPVGGVPTTTPLRTAVDLLCFADETTAVAGTRALLAQGLAAGDVREALNRPRRRLPVQRALGRLALAEAGPGRWLW